MKNNFLVSFPVSKEDMERFFIIKGEYGLESVLKKCYIQTFNPIVDNAHKVV